MIFFFCHANAMSFTEKNVFPHALEHGKLDVSVMGGGVELDHP